MCMTSEYQIYTSNLYLLFSHLGCQLLAVTVFRVKAFKAGAKHRGSIMQKVDRQMGQVSSGEGLNSFAEAKVTVHEHITRHQI
jgi:hypothetical protein